MVRLAFADGGGLTSTGCPFPVARQAHGHRLCCDSSNSVLMPPAADTGLPLAVEPAEVSYRKSRFQAQL